MAGLTKGMIADVHRKKEIRLPADFFQNEALQGLKAAMVIYFERSGEIRLIPMTKEGRSLNLAISTGIILYDAIKQNFTTYKELM